MNRLNRDIGAAVRPLGFRGSRGSWMLTTAGGVAQVATSRRSRPGEMSAHVGFVVVPVAWWEYVNWRAARWGRPAVALGRDALSHDIGFVETRRRPEHAHCHLPLDPGAVEHAASALGDAARVLARTAIDLLRPGRYLQALLDIDDIGYGMWEPIVVLLAERGPTTELDRAIDGMCASYAEHGAERPEHVIDYARARASI
jgi:hypothetical protein